MPAELPRRLANLGDRVVLGSDFPNIPYPYATQLEALARLDLGDDWLRGVLWTNGVRLLGLDPDAATVSDPAVSLPGMRTSSADLRPAGSDGIIDR
jgi:hypothetical protein